MECLSCHADNPESGRFCTQCGAALPTKCIQCGAVNLPESRFCGSCGVSLAVATRLSNGFTAATSRLPSPSKTNYISSGERRHLTVLFCDIVGSTSLAKSLDPEELNEITRRYYDCCTDAIHQFEGLVANYIGDGVMALFGYPRAHEDDAERAIRAALTIISAVRAANAKSEARVRVRIGIATGLVVVGEDGTEPLTKEKTVVGEAPNLAAHLQSESQPNNILISDATRRLVGDVFKLEELKLGRLKGGNKPVTIWRVIGEKEVTSRFAAHAVSFTNFVGRDQEVALLTDRWHQAVQGEGQVLVLLGEAGIGKSRIVEAFRQLVSNESHTTVRYQCSPYHIDSALHPIIRQLEHAAGLAAEDSPSVKLDKLEALLRRGTTSLKEVIPLFAALLSIPTDGRCPPLDPDPQRRKERTLNALIDQLAGLAQEGSVLIILEDVHWADPTTLEFLGRTIPRLSEMHVLLIMTGRPEFKVRWTHYPQVTALLLNRLARQHCRAMVESIAEKTLPSEVMEQIIAKTDGVPLFVEELTKTVLEFGIVGGEGSRLAAYSSRSWSLPFRRRCRIRSWRGWIDLHRSRRWRRSAPRSVASSLIPCWQRCPPCAKRSSRAH